MPPGISALFENIPLSQETVQNVSQALRRDARREEVPEEKVEWFEAWTLAFISWCTGQAQGADNSPQVTASQIGDFQVDLRGRPEITRPEAVAAMDALAFLFGAAEETKSALQSVGFSVENGEGAASQPSSENASGTDKEAPSTDTTDRSQIGRTFPGWPDQEESSGKPAIKKSTTSNRDSIFHPASYEDGTSTAKEFVRAYHSQLDAMHDSEPGNSTGIKEKMQSARGG